MYTGKIVLDFDKIYESNSCGPFKIIKDLGKDERSRLWVRIKFLNTGYEKDVRYDTAMDGKVRDDVFGIEFNKTFQSYSYGPYQIISYLGRNQNSDRFVRVRFLNTGCEIDVNYDLVRVGFIKDPTVKFEDRTSMSVKETEDYSIKMIAVLKSRWRAMMSRCYNPNNQSYNEYGAKGVTVCKYWHDFNNFLESVHAVKNFDKFFNDPAHYYLDKDYLQQNIPVENRVYSPLTCTFLNMVDNSNLSMKESGDHIYGIKETTQGNYLVEFSVNGKKYNFGTYTNLQAALNEYNYYYLVLGRFELVPLLNNVEFMPHYEAIKYLKTKSKQI